MTQPNEVMIFRKPIESPAATITDTDIRVLYGEYWIDFRDGKILVRDDEGNRIALVHTNEARPPEVYICEQCAEESAFYSGPLSVGYDATKDGLTPPEVYECEQCGAALLKETVICRNCGARYSHSLPPSALDCLGFITA